MDADFGQVWPKEFTPVNKHVIMLPGDNIRFIQDKITS